MPIDFRVHGGRASLLGALGLSIRGLTTSGQDRVLDAI
jgi:hypothetical protein